VSTLPWRAPAWWRPCQDQFRQWRVWRGDNKRYCARLPGTDPRVIVHGRTIEELIQLVTELASKTG
jgi:hypothetical protein